MGTGDRGLMGNSMDLKLLLRKILSKKVLGVRVIYLDTLFYRMRNCTLEKDRGFQETVAVGPEFRHANFSLSFFLPSL